MKTSPSGLAALTLFEGVRTEAYQDSVGVWTIGIGHTAAAGSPQPFKGMIINRLEASHILARDLLQYEAAVTKRMPNVPQHVFDGAVSFCFNLGVGAFGSASWVAKFLDGNFDAAEHSFKTWNHAGQQVIPGLTRRRGMEADMIFRNKYPSGIAPPSAFPSPAAERPPEPSIPIPVHDAIPALETPPPSFWSVLETLFVRWGWMTPSKP